jgi:GDPmannose 4,6-dehydratase
MENPMKRALICGVSGQDGAYLARLLLEKGYEVHGASRDAPLASFSNLAALGIKEKVRFWSLIPTDLRSVLTVFDAVHPDEVYNLAGQSSVGLSFKEPVETFESNVLGNLNMLEALRILKAPILFYSACSGECFGDTGGRPSGEDTPFRPRSPYAVAKAAAFWEVANYREAYGVFACSGILFNHESPLRSERFVTRKIIAAAARIANGSKEKLVLGNINISRDWGWAPEYVDAMHRMLQCGKPEDFVVATGETRTLEDFVQVAFSSFNLDWRKHVSSDPALFRPSDIPAERGDPSKAMRILGWKAEVRMEEVVRRMVAAEKERFSRSTAGP